MLWQESTLWPKHLADARRFWLLFATREKSLGAGSVMLEFGTGGVAQSLEIYICFIA